MFLHRVAAFAARPFGGPFFYPRSQKYSPPVRNTHEPRTSNSSASAARSNNADRSAQQIRVFPFGREDLRLESGGTSDQVRAHRARREEVCAVFAGLTGGISG